MLNQETIQANTERFISLISSIEREGFRKDELINKLLNSDFFKAPASSKYHCDFEGGLCYHSLNVYDQLVKLCEMQYPDRVETFINDNNESEERTIKTCPYSEDTLKIVALLHDISKMNFYTVETKNVKKYFDGGSKSDDKGKYDWITEPYYAVREGDSRFIFGNHEENSYYMISRFTPLNVDEAAAILNHMGGMGKNLNPTDLSNQSEVYSKYHISCLLHIADLLATFIIEGRTKH